MSEQTIDELKTAAIESADPVNPMFAYHTHLKGRESEYSYAEFLEDIKSDAFEDHNSNNFELDKLFRGERKETHKEALQSTLTSLHERV